MGEYADMIIDGLVDQYTGELIDGDSPGYPRSKNRKKGVGEVRCQQCSKRFTTQQGVADHTAAVHGGAIPTANVVAAGAPGSYQCYESDGSVLSTVYDIDGQTMSNGQIVNALNELLVYKRAMDSMAAQLIHPKMTGLDMAKSQLGITKDKETQ